MGLLKRRIIELMEPTEYELARRWIPVEERLPDVGQQVLAAIAPRAWNKENPAIIETLDYEKDGFYSWQSDEYHSRVVAWMPLPEPPKVK